MDSRDVQQRLDKYETYSTTDSLYLQEVNVVDEQNSPVDPQNEAQSGLLCEGNSANQRAPFAGAGVHT